MDITTEKQNNFKNDIRKQRKSNFELLRIFSMILIISFHYVYKSGYIFETLTINSYIVKVFWLLGELGVNLFMLITGYFMINGSFKLKKVLMIFSETVFYCFLNVLLEYYVKGSVSKTSIYYAFFPIITNQYWFVTVYIIIYILSPFLNKLIVNMNKGEYQKLLGIVLWLWCIVPTIFGLWNNSTEVGYFYSRLIWLIIIYFIGAYIKLYDIKLFNSKGKALSIAFSTFILMMLSILGIYVFRDSFEKIGTIEYAYLWTPNNVFMLLLSISIFEIFCKVEIQQMKIVNILASTTLGVYMLHDGATNWYLWNTIFKNKIMLASNFSIVFILGTAIVIFIFGAIIDLVRQVVEKYTLKKFLDSNIFMQFGLKIKMKFENFSQKHL